MEEAALKELISISPYLGIFAIAIGVLWRYVVTLNKKNIDFTNQRINELKDDIKDLKTENKNDKDIFNRAVISFEKSVLEFSSTSNKMDRLEKDVEYIKNKIG